MSVDNAILKIRDICYGHKQDYIGIDDWDRQTVIIKCKDLSDYEFISSEIHESLMPNSKIHISDGIIIEGYVNLNYAIDEKDPAKRNVRIVYAMMDYTTDAELTDRFPNAIHLMYGSQGGIHKMMK